MYLREMGTVPLLTREGEVEIAKRIERGKKAVLRVIARTPMAAQEVARLAERLRAGEIGVRDVVVFNEEEVTEEKLETKIKETLKLTDKVAEAHKEYLAYRKQFVKLNKRSPRYVPGQVEAGPPAHRGLAGHPQHRVQRGGEAPPDRAHPRVGGADPRGRGEDRPARAQAQGEGLRRLQEGHPQADPRAARDPERDRGGVRHPHRRAEAHAAHRDRGRAARPSRPRRSWSRPTCAWSSRSPRSTRTAACSSWTSSRRATSAS